MTSYGEPEDIRRAEAFVAGLKLVEAPPRRVSTLQVVLGVVLFLVLAVPALVLMAIAMNPTG